MEIEYHDFDDYFFEGNFLQTLGFDGYKIRYLESRS